MRWVLALTQFLLIMDTALLNVAVPAIGVDLDLKAAQQSWVLNAYTVAFGGLLLLSGCLADSFGRGRILTIGLVLLAVGAGVGAVAPSGGLVIASRAAQGVGAALAGASAMALVFSLFSGVARQKVLGLFAAMAGLGGAIGTVLGGILTEWLSWRATFWLNVAAALTLVAATRKLRMLRTPVNRRSFNAGGAVTLTVALALIAYALTYAPDMGWTATPVLLAAAIAVVALTVFVATERTAASPLVDRTVWNNKPLLGALGLAGIGQWALVPALFFVSLYLQLTLHQSPAVTGLALLPMSIAICLIVPAIPRFIGRFGLRVATVAAFALVALALLWLTQITPDTTFLTVVLGPTLIIAVGLPAVSITTNIAAASTSPADRPGVASGLLTTAQQFGATLGLAAWVTIATAAEDYGLAASTQGFPIAFGTAAGVSIAAAGFAGLRAWPPRSAPSTPSPASDQDLASPE